MLTLGNRGLKQNNLLIDMKETKTVKAEDYWYCDRCKISSTTKERMCPCPRGSCEAYVKGVYTITKEFKPIQQ